MIKINATPEITEYIFFFVTINDKNQCSYQMYKKNCQSIYKLNLSLLLVLINQESVLFS